MVIGICSVQVAHVQAGPLTIEAHRDANAQQTQINSHDEVQGPTVPFSAPTADSNALPACVNVPGGVDSITIPSSTRVINHQALPGQWLHIPECKDGLPAAAQPGLQWALDQQATVAQHLQSGTLTTYPKLDHQLCNLPTIFFIKGAGVNGDEKTYLQQSTTLAGYTFIFITKLEDVGWSWGDNSHRQLTGAGGLGQDKKPPMGISTVNHPYDKIGEYQIKADERWSVTATMIDPDGHITALPQASKEFHQQLTTTGQVGQVEGVPVNG
ncbi:MAG: hypothetical protein ACREN8_11665 [Candidatus Dormibacteraceae bacterium]